MVHLFVDLNKINSQYHVEWDSRSKLISNKIDKIMILIINDYRKSFDHYEESFETKIYINKIELCFSSHLENIQMS